MEGLGAFGRPDDSRCYWTILDQDLQFRYLDPVASVNFGEVSGLAVQALEVGVVCLPVCHGGS